MPSFPVSRSPRRSRRHVVACVLALLAAGTYAARRYVSLPSGASGSAPAAGESCAVLSVTDGDTIRVSCGGAETRVRLLRINTPERGQPGAHQATEALRELVGGRAVSLEFETPGKEERDAYGRLLAYVFVQQTNVNVEMVRLGWSRFWTRYGEGRLADAFRQAERQAREAKRGIWVLEGN